jgi:hypothetical protein
LVQNKRPAAAKTSKTTAAPTKKPLAKAATNKATMKKSPLATQKAKDTKKAPAAPKKTTKPATTKKAATGKKAAVAKKATTKKTISVKRAGAKKVRRIYSQLTRFLSMHTGCCNWYQG